MVTAVGGKGGRQAMPSILKLSIYVHFQFLICVCVFILGDNLFRRLNLQWL